MKKVLLFLLIISLTHLKSQWVEKAPENPEEFVNPLIGTLSKPSLSNGNTYPAVAVPHGMNLWTPQTGKNGNGWQYTYDADKIRGIKQTHQPSPWMNDYGMFSIMPVTGKMRFSEDERASWFSHKSEVSKPYYYSVYLADHNVTAEITPTERAAQLRLTYPDSPDSWFVVDAFDKGSGITIIPSQNKITGYSTKYSRGKLVGFKNYFVIYADKPFKKYSTWKDKDFVKDALELPEITAGLLSALPLKKVKK